jgi:GTP-binding protein EngB required for normal cell division
MFSNILSCTQKYTNLHCINCYTNRVRKFRILIRENNQHFYFQPHGFLDVHIYCSKSEIKFTVFATKYDKVRQQNCDVLLQEAEYIARVT